MGSRSPGSAKRLARAIHEISLQPGHLRPFVVDIHIQRDARYSANEDGDRTSLTSPRHTLQINVQFPIEAKSAPWGLVCVPTPLSSFLGEIRR